MPLPLPFALLLLQADAEAAPDPLTPQLYENGWFAGEAGNNCSAMIETGDGSTIMINLTKWDDLSDHILLWRKDLAPLWSEDGYETGKSAEEEDADAERGFGLSVSLTSDSTSYTDRLSATNAMLIDALGRPGISYRFGVNQKAFAGLLPFIDTLVLRRDDKVLAEVSLDPAFDMGFMMRDCVDRNPSF